MIRVRVWHENTPEQEKPGTLKVYPEGLGASIAAGLRDDGIEVVNAYLSDPEQGLSESDLDRTDVLIWWGHCKHDIVSDETAARVANAVQRGMGAIFLHSAHMSKPFRLLMGTSCTLHWREADERERLWIVAPAHPIACGLPDSFALEREEMYGEFFDVPRPDDIIFIGWFQGGNVFRSGLTYSRGMGKVFYFQPGHETYPTFCDSNVRRIIANAVKWAHPTQPRLPSLNCPCESTPLEKIQHTPRNSCFK